MTEQAIQALLGDPFFPRLKATVIENTGMAFYADKDGDLARIVAARMEQIGAESCFTYLDLIADPHQGGEEMDALVAELTIGETYFFRHREQFDALRDIILPSVLERNRAIKSLRIWSAGCSIGPEPYTLAILLKREFATQLAGWRMEIVATDINQKFLARAREGLYDEWAFRATSDDVRRECFEPVGRQWRLKPEYRSCVNFRYHNLIKDRFPSRQDNITSFDIIICRNVVIYFSKETIEGLIPCFHQSLVDGGWLVMGHAEPSQELFREFRTVNVPGAVLYQRVDAPAPLPLRVAPAAPPVLRPLAPLPPRPRPQPAPAVPPAAAQPAAADVVVRRARELADQGAWTQALATCDQGILANALDARLHYYRALIVEQMGDAKGCETSLRRAIYLDRHFVLPHYHLGLFLLRRDEAAAAQRSFRNVLALLKRLPDGQSVGEADTMTVSQLREIVDMHLSRIGAS